ncbi:MAG: hypothetical protein IJT44_03375 [Clostridia bacterium]|nr:hypothetical protein [Clostridia bacterium]
MKQILLCDRTLCRQNGAFSFKEKIEIARLLENLSVDAVELPVIENVRTDVLLVKTVSSFVKKSVLSVDAGGTAEGIDNAAAALMSAAHGRIRISLPVSTVGMEYGYHKKAPKMLALAESLVAKAKEACADVEFCALDATRAEEGFLPQLAKAVVAAGADAFTLCDIEGTMLPDTFSRFVGDFIRDAQLPPDVCVGVQCSNANGLAVACAVMAVQAGANVVKTACGGDVTDLGTFGTLLKNCGTDCGLCADLELTRLGRIFSQITRFSGESVRQSAADAEGEDEGFHFDEKDTQETVAAAVRRLGYDLSVEDEGKVYEEFRRVAVKKNVGVKELEAIVASAAHQVPSAYKLISYVINTGNVFTPCAQIKLEKDGKLLSGIGMGDGPIDAAFLTIDQIVGRHYELDDFQIQSVTEGKEAMASTLVKLRFDGKLYSGNGLSTDIVGAGIRAYVNALNKIVYEEDAR